MNLCLISSNIRFDNPADGVNAWPYRRVLLTEMLLQHQPDIIATQEGRHIQLKDFESLLQNYELIESHRSWIKERMYPTFFVRKDAFEVSGSDDVWLSETPEIPGSVSFGSAFPRLMTWMKIRPKNSETHFLFVNTHLDHVKKETRLDQIKVLSEETRKLLDANSRLVIMGDFNDSPDSEVRGVLESSFPQLQDAWKKFNSIEETSHHAFSGECQNGSRIDWVLVDKKISVENCFLEKKSIAGKYPSDHFPVICKIKL